MNIALRDVSKHFGARQALSSLTLHLDPQGLLVVGGPNGAGKSVFLKLLAGVVEPTGGAILWEGRPLLARKLDFKFRIGYMPQNPTFYEDHTVARCLGYFARLKALPGNFVQARVETVVTMIRLKSAMRRKVKHLSGGERSRLAFGIALLNDPDLLLLDEPGANLDPTERQELWDLIATMKTNRSIVLATHVFAGLEGATDRFLILESGAVVEDAPVKVLHSRAAQDVWIVTTPSTSSPDWIANCFVIRRRQTGSSIEWRVLADVKPTVDAELAIPTLEDMYLWVRWRHRTRSDTRWVPQVRTL